MKLDRRQLQVGGNVPILNREDLVHILSLHPLGRYGRRSNGGTTAKRLELGVEDCSVWADFNLKLHDIAASGSTNKTLCKEREKSQSENLIFGNNKFLKYVMSVVKIT